MLPGNEVGSTRVHAHGATAPRAYSGVAHFRVEPCWRQRQEAGCPATDTSLSRGGSSRQTNSDQIDCRAAVRRHHEPKMYFLQLAPPGLFAKCRRTPSSCLIIGKERVRAHTLALVRPAKASWCLSWCGKGYTRLLPCLPTVLGRFTAPGFHYRPK